MNNMLFYFTPKNVGFYNNLGVFYEFPLSVTAYFTDEKKGRLFFKSNALFENECKNFPAYFGGMTNYETAKILNNREIFIEDGSEYMSPIPANLYWTFINGQKFFIYSDLFKESDRNIGPQSFWVPLSTEAPVEHLSRQKSGNYDTEEIYGWPLLRYIDR